MTCHNRSPQKITVSEVTGSGFFGGSVGKSCGQKRERERASTVFYISAHKLKINLHKKKKRINNSAKLKEQHDLRGPQISENYF